MSADRRPVALRRTWLFVPGADPGAAAAALAARPDVAILELEDFTRPQDRPAARAQAPALFEAWRRAGIVATVRINPLADCGAEDLAAAMVGRPDAVLLPKTADAGQVRELDALVTSHEHALGIPPGFVELVPNVEGALGLVRAFDIARASPRVTACLVASEDMATDLGCERSSTLAELDHVRGRFLVDCIAAGVLAIDMPWTWADADGAGVHARSARRLGYRAKSLVEAAHVAPVAAALTPQPDEIALARRQVAAFEAAREAGQSRALVDGLVLEMPAFRNAQALLQRAEALSAVAAAGQAS